jgi:catecholate siderophore receptor
VVTKEFIRDQNFQSLTEVTRYVPGVAIHQGEGNRDELVIRGVDSSANFFVNGFRDDVQYYRDLYNTQSIEVLKGPSALIFGRGAGGGLVNRTLKEADGTRVYEARRTVGSWNTKRVTMDAGQAVNENVAVRFNAMYENSDTFRQYGHLERYGINPTVTLKPSDDTKIKLSYEFYHDFRLADRGNPSQGLPGAGATRFNPTGRSRRTATSRPSSAADLQHAKVEVQTGMAIIEHDFGNGLTVRNGTIYADYNRGYRNVYPGGAVNPAQTLVALSAYENQRRARTPSTRPTLSTRPRPVRCCTRRLRHRVRPADRPVAAQQRPVPDQRRCCHHQRQSVQSDLLRPGHLQPHRQRRQQQVSAQRRVRLRPGSDRSDTLAAIAGRGALRPVRSSALDQNTNIIAQRTDDFISPRAAVIVKPIDSVSLTRPGASLPAGLGRPVQRAEHQHHHSRAAAVREQGSRRKWNINPRLLFTAAAYEMLRANVPINIGNGVSIPGGAHIIRGGETR